MNDEIMNDVTDPSGIGGLARTVFVTSVCVLVGAGLAAGVFLAFNWLGTRGDPARAPAPSGPTVLVQRPADEQPTPPGRPAPSPAIETVQRELAQLNYYEGPITGTMTPQTVQAISYLQRDAHLPQTGRLDAATEAALADFLAHGNNQLGS